MPGKPVEDNGRLSLRVAPEDKALMVRASVLERADLTEFVPRSALAEAREVIERHERVALSARDSLQVMALLENPPEPNEKLMAAAFALPKAG